MIKTTTKEHDDMTRHAIAALAERGITTPTTELLRLELMNQHLAEAGYMLRARLARVQGTP